MEKKNKSGIPFITQEEVEIEEVIPGTARIIMTAILSFEGWELGADFGDSVRYAFRCFGGGHICTILNDLLERIYDKLMNFDCYIDYTQSKSYFWEKCHES